VAVEPPAFVVFGQAGKEVSGFELKGFAEFHANGMD
jgi:hypothetical protein